MWWIIGILIVGVIIYKFVADLNKDNDDLQSQSSSDKFSGIVKIINAAAFGGKGEVYQLNRRVFNLYKDGENQIINFDYSTGSLTITWKFKYFQQEVVHRRQFDDVRMISMALQERIGNQMVNEMPEVIERHMKRVLGRI